VNSWKVILATIVIFGAGVLTGALVVQFTTGMYGPRHQRPWFGARSPEAGSPGGMRLEFLRRMQRDLDLTSDQRDRIDKILKQSQERTRKLMEPVSPQLHLELQRAKSEFRDALTPPQQERFDDLLKQAQRFKEQHRSLGHPQPSLTNTAITNSI
jgi:Spy/CpxP family protein refolding chaperone